jgi:hypothetical protein
MPQQIDPRIIESAMITIPQNFAARLQMNCDAESSTLCRNVGVSPDKEEADNLRFCIRLDMRRRQTAKTLETKIAQLRLSIWARTKRQ